MTSVILGLQLNALKNLKIIHNTPLLLFQTKINRYSTINKIFLKKNLNNFYNVKYTGNSFASICSFSTKEKLKFDKSTIKISDLEKQELDENKNKCNASSSTTITSSSIKKRSQESTVEQEKNQQNKTQQLNSPSQGDGTSYVKLGLFAKFKLMYKQYWYVLIPVHVITSIGWFGGFYYLSKSGVDIPSLLQTLHISESIIDKLKDSDMGHIAVAYLCYKIATPARYAVTVGGTTISIKYLVQAEYIKPMPTKSELIRMYEKKKAKRKQEKGSKSY